MNEAAQGAFPNIWARSQAAMVDEMFTNLRRASRLPMLWQNAQRVKKGCTPSEIVYEEDRLKLLHYLSDEPRKYKTPLVFVYALVNRPYILDLMPGRSVVDQFVKAGFDTYLIDWGEPTHADRHLTLDSYVNGYLSNVMSYLNERTGSRQVSVLGYCMGGTMSAMYTALHQERVKNLMLLATGIDFSPKDGLLGIWADPKNFDVDAFVDAYGNCPAQFLQGAFLLLKPISNFVEKPINLVEHAEDTKATDEFFAMETWLNDNISLPGEVFREFVKYIYQQNRLVKNRMPVGTHTVNLKKITCPVLNIMATKDDLVPCAQSEPFNDLVGSPDRGTLKLQAGHIGLAVGTRAQRELWPKAVQWLGDRSEAA